MNIKIIVVLILIIIISGCVESKPSTPTSIDNPGSPQVTQTPGQKIIIDYSARKEDAISMYSIAADGKTFLIITMNIINKGYKEFRASPFSFDLIANNIKYNSASSTLQLEDKLDSVELLDGGMINGSIAFEVPSNIESYQLQYSGFGDYNIDYRAH